ncbi:MAG: Rieske (2Fe-2S) protein [Micrococcales bacterium]
MDNCSGSCDHNATKIDGGIKRRALLAGIAGVLASIGLSGEAAFAAAKTYTVAKKSDIPLRSGELFRVNGTPIFITQPKAGVFRAFSGLCTHERQELGGMVGKNIACYQHGATFDPTTGAATGGPTKKALKKITLTVSGNNLKVTI